MNLTIYSKSNQPLHTTQKFTYQGSFMGERSVGITVESPTKIEFLPEDYVEFRNERFVLDYTPTAVKNASPLSKGDAFVYELKFMSLRHELEKCTFRDIVPADNQQHYTGITSVQFTGDVKQLARRIKANLDVLYPNAWTITVLDSVSLEVKNITLSDQNCLDALALVQSEYKLNFTIKNRTITIGTVGVTHDHTFEYGKGNGLYSITRTSVDSDAIVTKLRAYGSNENIPRNYKKGAGSLLPQAQYIPSLMLPNYETTLIDYVEAGADSKRIYGTREGIFKDETIKPSIKWMTGEQIRAAGGSSISNGRVDEVVLVSPITDDKQATFKLSIKDIGFNIKDQLGDDKPMVEFTDGRLGGVACEISTVIKTSTGYDLTLIRNNDSNFLLPDKITTASAGDHFVITGIFMPDLYVKAAEQRLLARAQEYLSEYDHAKSTYAIGMDEIFMASHSLKDSIFEGDLLRIKDNDLAVNTSIIIQQLNIKHGDSPIPSYEVTLSDKPVATTLSRVQSDITEIERNTTVIKTSGEKMARRNVSGLTRLKDYTFDPETGKLRPENLAVNSIDSMYLSVGAKASDFKLTATIYDNYKGDPNKLGLTSGSLIHREIAHGDISVDASYVWALTSSEITLADPNRIYFLYAKCSTTTSNATWMVSDQMLRYNSDDNWYYFSVGMIYEVANGVRVPAMYYGRTFINGRTITTGRVQSADGSVYFDLDQNKLEIGAAAKKEIVDGIEIGGRNLFPNSSFENGAHIGLGSNCVIGQAPFDGGTLNAKNGTKVLFLNRFSEDSYWFFNSIQVEPNSTYTMSYWYMSAGAITSHSSYSYITSENVNDIQYIGTPQPIVLTNKVWTFHKFTFTTNSNTRYFYFRYGFHSSSYSWSALDCLKLEKGNKATDWAPAPEDVQSEIDSAKIAAANAQSDATFAKARTQGRTVIEGGVVETQIVQLGNGGIAGMSGIPTDNNGKSLPSRWAGGTYAQAIAGTATIIENFDGSVKYGDFRIDQSGAVTIKDTGGVSRVLMTKGDVSTAESISNSTQNTTVVNSLQGKESDINAVEESVYLPNTVTVNNNQSSVNILFELHGVITSLEGSGEDGEINISVFLNNNNTGEDVFIDNLLCAYPQSHEVKIVNKTLTLPAATYRVNIVRFQRGVGVRLYSYISDSTVKVIYDGAVQRTEIGKNGVGVVHNAKNYTLYQSRDGKYNVIEKVQGTYDRPGVLLSSSINSSGSLKYSWGAYQISSITKLGVGQYRVYHNIGHSQYFVHITSGLDGIFCSREEVSASSFRVTCRRYNGDFSDAEFDVIITGNNQPPT